MSGLYTGGNWEVTKWSSHKHLHISSDINSERYGSLMFIADCGNYDEKDGLPYNPDVEANARLISAAPDLYLALKECAQYFRDKILTQYERDETIPYFREYEIAVKAIAKAETKKEDNNG